ncbi:Hypothetical predicted protein [Mytilus galloprovincialis]|uniref:Ig-like domain-containing protein n=1 Tax=Mytilus galloprovincialis TaxID=29158 RepID=A0A8B6F9D4_MYTGA|nr:Hypothetical predicted protein [Mytilus galloprovincialis]
MFCLVVDIWFINQTEIHTLIGQAGKEMKINCSTDKAQYITALKIESNGSILAIGDNQSVSYSFIPKRTDHLTSYTCVDITHSSIMIEATLIIRYAPAVTLRYTNGTIECDCDGVPPVNSVYRLDRISKYGELVYSINLDNGIFVFNTDQFPYQRNGRYVCVVSNCLPSTNGKELQSSSTHVIYEGPPVFAKENIYVNHGKVGQSSIRMSFLVYSCPDVEEIFLQKLGRMRGKKRKLHTYVLKSTLLYNELDIETGVPGYNILIESDDLDIEDFQAYIITVQNRLGASDYHFGIIKKEGHVIDQRERKYVLTICIVGAVLFVSIILHFGFFVKRARRSVPIHSNENDDRTYHTYEEIGSMLYGGFRNIPSSNTNNTQYPNLTQEHADTILNEYNVQSTDNNLTESNADLPNDELQQHGVPGVHVQHMSISTGDTNIIDDTEQLSDQQSQASNDSDSELSQTVIIGNFGDRPIIRSSTDYIGKIQEISQTISDAGSESSGNAMVGNVGNEYENNYQLQDSHQYLIILDDRSITLSSTDSIAKLHQRSRTISDAISRSSNKVLVDNVRNEYENTYQLQDGHQYLIILDDRPIIRSSTDSIAKLHQRSQTISDAGSESSNNSMVAM